MNIYPTNSSSAVGSRPLTGDEADALTHYEDVEDCLIALVEWAVDPTASAAEGIDLFAYAHSLIKH